MTPDAHLGGSHSAARSMVKYRANLLKGNPREPLDKLRYLGTVF
jgi:hypothetical protein